MYLVNRYFDDQFLGAVTKAFIVVVFNFARQAIIVDPPYIEDSVPVSDNKRQNTSYTNVFNIM